MLEAEVETLHQGRIIKVRLSSGDEPLPFARVLRLWQEDEPFRLFFLEQLADAPFDTYRWETPPLTSSTSGRPFEYVLLDSPGLASRPDSTPFAEHLHLIGDDDDGVIAFPNLGHDAQMVVPARQGPLAAYGHLAAFTRGAPRRQNHALWMMVGREMERLLGDRTLWLSTAGGGVSWLHVRLDSWPKYYGYGPYRES